MFAKLVSENPERRTKKPRLTSARRDTFRSVRKMHRSGTLLLAFYFTVALGTVVVMTVLGDPLPWIYRVGDNVSESVRMVIEFFAND